MHSKNKEMEVVITRRIVKKRVKFSDVHGDGDVQNDVRDGDDGDVQSEHVPTREEIHDGGDGDHDAHQCERGQLEECIQELQKLVVELRR
ncbi:hypothetical protein B9Z55_025436 [Caenorhabditis nigoni]|uniref:Uncharacterized protein n=1 Tax=Caenorhabditis nigoni TaxID=1611254 RepID=A0A2G5SYU4_9PELO|nr:hypothetical protein B9Z55_025436 [Caenorhabditis nigoni]